MNSEAAGCKIQQIGMRGINTVASFLVGWLPEALVPDSLKDQGTLQSCLHIYSISITGLLHSRQHSIVGS